MSQMSETETGYHGTLNLRSTSQWSTPYGADIATLSLDIVFETADTVRVRITDATKSRWEVIWETFYHSFYSLTSYCDRFRSLWSPAVTRPPRRRSATTSCSTRHRPSASQSFAPRMGRRCSRWTVTPLYSPTSSFKCPLRSTPLPRRTELERWAFLEYIFVHSVHFSMYSCLTAIVYPLVTSAHPWFKVHSLGC